MYTNFESHLAALMFLGTLALLFLLAVAALAMFFWRRAWLRYPLLAIAALLAGYGLLLAAFSFTSYDRTVARGDEKFFCCTRLPYRLLGAEGGTNEDHRRHDRHGRVLCGDAAVAL